MSAEVGSSSASTIRSAARGALAAACLELAGHLGILAGWTGGSRGGSALLVAATAAVAASSALASVWNRLARRPLASLGLSILCLAAFALLPRRPTLLHPTGSAAVDAALVALLPALPLAAQLARRPTSAAAAALGALVALVVDQAFLLPRAGFGLSLLAWAAVWAAAEGRTWDLPAPQREPPRLIASAAALAVCAAFGAALAAARPFLAQHLPPERAGTVTIAIAVLSMSAVGWLAASTIRNGWILLASTCAALALGIGGAWVSWTSLEVVGWSRWPASFGALRDEVASPQRTLLASWIFLAFPSLCAGFVTRGMRAAGASSWLVAWIGLVAGTYLGERRVLPALQERGAWEPAARARLRHPERVPPRSYALVPDGIAVAYPEPSGTSFTETRAWQGIPWSRGTDPQSIEALEVRLGLATSSPAGAGRPDEERLLCAGPMPLGFELAEPRSLRDEILSLDPFPRPGSAAEGAGDLADLWSRSPLRARGAVLLSSSAPSQALFLAGTRTALAHVARELGSDRPLWVWCDPRAFEPEGVRTTLETWRAACPSGQVHVVLDGYAGPLLGLQASGPEPASPDLERRTLARMKVTDLPRSSAGVATADRPLLAWQLDPSPSPSGLPKPAVLRALTSATGLPPRGGAAGLLEGLARHAEAQELRSVAASSYDRIRIPEEELEAYGEALRRDPVCEPLVRHLAFVGDLLFRKRDFDLLVTATRAALVVRPDSAELHRDLGRALGELLDPEGSVVELDQAYSLDPGSRTIRVEFSKALARVRRFGEAARILESLWQEDPAIEIAKGMGITYLEMKDYPRARQYLEYVHARTPGDADVEGALERMNREGR